MSLSEVLGLIDFTRISDATSSHSRQIIAGVASSTSDVNNRWMMKLSESKFAHLHRTKHRISGLDRQATRTNDLATSLLQATSFENSVDIVCLALKNKLSNLLSIDANDISESESITRHGADSLVAVELRNWILLELKANITMLDILAPRPIAEFALTVAKSSEIILTDRQLTEIALQNDMPNIHPKEHDSTEEIREIIDTHSTELRSWHSEPMLTGVVHPPKEVILLTGGSGSIGANLLNILCRSPKVSKVYALLRGETPNSSLRASYEKQGLDPDDLPTEKLEILEYKMTDPLLGLGQELYTRLSREVTTVIHLAWKVDFFNPIHQFRDSIQGKLSLLSMMSLLVAV